MICSSNICLWSFTNGAPEGSLQGLKEPQPAQAAMFCSVAGAEGHRKSEPRERGCPCGVSHPSVWERSVRTLAWVEEASTHHMSVRKVKFPAPYSFPSSRTSSTLGMSLATHVVGGKRIEFLGRGIGKTIIRLLFTVDC